MNNNTFEQLMFNNFKIIDTDKVSLLSSFKDDIWDFNDFENLRLQIYDKSSLRIQWVKYRNVLPDTILDSIKILAFFYVKLPNIIILSKKSFQNEYHPATIKRKFRDLLIYFKVLIDKSNEDKKNYCKIEDLFDIHLQDLQKALDHFPHKKRVTGHDSILIMLRQLANPIITKYLANKKGRKELKWNIADIDTLLFIPKNKKKSVIRKSFSHKPLPDSLFLLLSTTATSDIISFLYRYGLKIQSMNIDSALKITETGFLKENVDVNKILEIGLSNNVTQSSCEKIVTDLKLAENNEAKKIITRIHGAATYLLFQYTGMRYSEGATLKKNALFKHLTGEMLLRGTLIKKQSLKLTPDNELWVAPPIVQDAILTLSTIGSLIGAEYLVYSCYANNKKVQSVDTINKILSNYLILIDENNQYSIPMYRKRSQVSKIIPDYRLSTQRIRHTLVFHLSRVGVGLPYISYHLKHLHETWQYFDLIKDVTLEYGNVGKDLYSNGKAIHDSSKGIINSLYHPEAPIAGPGASELINRRKAYFTGKMATGKSIEDVIDQLYSSGIIYADVGLGYCRGKKPFESSDQEQTQLPPCIGQLACNPAQCKNAVIPESKRSNWLAIYKENKRRLSDPDLSHSAKVYQQIVNDAYKILIDLGVNENEL